MISIILGTRPEIIKMSPIIRECETQGHDYFVLHTGQHYSYEMDGAFFDDLELPKPQYNLDVGSGSHAEQTARILTGVEKILIDTKPDLVLVQGDTNSVLAGALTAAKLYIDVGHVEAGLRSFDRRMPEEINRILTDHISEFLFTPTEKADVHLLSEGIDKRKIYRTGNTIVDAVHQNLTISENKADILKEMGLETKGYFLITAHRQENVDSPERLQKIISTLQKIQKEYDIPIIFPMHPRTKKMIGQFNIADQGITILDPVGFLSFLQLESNARLILTDSGGVQEEACILGVPCVTLRENTERPETVEVGANQLAGTDSAQIITSVANLLGQTKTWPNPFGDGNAGKKILNICTR
jgi:UDP-N-acetylglucosamine 2-epimerase (non-hydrolysing)